MDSRYFNNCSICKFVFVYFITSFRLKNFFVFIQVQVKYELQLYTYQKKQRKFNNRSISNSRKYEYTYIASVWTCIFLYRNFSSLEMLHRKCINFHQLRVNRNALIRTFLRVHLNQTAKIKTFITNSYRQFVVLFEKYT